MTDAPKLHSKLAAVMGEIGTIPKNGWNDFHKYQYVLEADIVEAVRSKLAEKHVAFYASSKLVETREWQTPKGKPTLITHVQVEITFADGETGETFTITSAGTGDDASDKGTYKAITGAVKYGLMKTFLIPTGDEPEGDSAQAAQAAANGDQPRTTGEAITAEIARLKASLGEANARTAYDLALQTAGVTPGVVPTQEQAEQILASLRAAYGVPA